MILFSALITETASAISTGIQSSRRFMAEPSLVCFTILAHSAPFRGLGIRQFSIFGDFFMFLVPPALI
jgi:hypothetical protein